MEFKFCTLVYGSCLAATVLSKTKSSESLSLSYELTPENPLIHASKDISVLYR